MNKYAVKLFSTLDNDAKVCIQVIVNSEMNTKQLKCYYGYLSSSISDVDVIEL